MLNLFVNFCIDRRRIVIGVVAAVTLLLALSASHIRVGTDFADLLPSNHPYIDVHNRFKATYGGANAVTIVLETEGEDIFRTEFLEKLKTLTLDLRKVEGVNPEQILSLASRKMKDVRASTEGISMEPLMFPEVPKDAEGLASLKTKVLKDKLVYGNFVSRDMKAALVSVDFYDHLLKPERAFAQIREIARGVEGSGVKVRMVGEPILAGWVAYYLPETVGVLAATLAALGGILLLTTRTWRGTLLPGLAGLMSGIWSLGTASLLGIGFDPLVIVVAFLITARSISHSVQLVTRFDDEIRAGVASAREAAKAAMLGLFKPGMLGVVADAGCMIIVILMPIPLMKKIAIIGTMWVSTIAISAMVVTPVCLSWLKLPLHYVHRLNLHPAIDRGLAWIARVVSGPFRYALVIGMAVIFVVSGYTAFGIQIGDANPGSPILRPDSLYNVDALEINKRFPGADRMFVVLAGDKEDVVKTPEALETMGRLQKFMEAQPEVGATLSLADIIPIIKRVLRDGNHRYEELGRTQNENGELLYLLNADPSDMERFADPVFKSAAVSIYFRDHQGETIRTAIARLKEFIAANPLPEMTLLLAGGFVGVTAAVNEVILSGQIESISLALLVLVLCCAYAYRSLSAGLFFMLPVMLSNTLTFSFMAWKGIGMNISTLPVAALGIGLGVDYAFYIVDDIREELAQGKTLPEAIALALAGAGKGVVVTAGALIIAVGLWSFSSLRFQAEMALLMAIWLGISALSALFLMPAMVAVFKPRFIFEVR